jgi:hypothetical protein
LGEATGTNAPTAISMLLENAVELWRPRGALIAMLSLEGATICWHKETLLHLNLEVILLGTLKDLMREWPEEKLILIIFEKVDNLKNNENLLINALFFY